MQCYGKNLSSHDRNPFHAGANEGARHVPGGGGVKLYDLELIREAWKTKRPCRVSMQYASLGRFGVSRISHEFKVETVAAGGAVSSRVACLMKNEKAALLLRKAAIRTYAILCVA